MILLIPFFFHPTFPISTVQYLQIKLQEAILTYMLFLIFVLLAVVALVVSKAPQAKTENSIADTNNPVHPDLELLEHQPININFFKYI